jgi:hypothetical protein
LPPEELALPHGDTAVAPPIDTRFSPAVIVKLQAEARKRRAELVGNNPPPQSWWDDQTDPFEMEGDNDDKGGISDGLDSSSPGGDPREGVSGER